MCQTCQGNGEVVTNWSRYLHPRKGDAADAWVRECTDCNGTGEAEPDPAWAEIEAKVAAERV